MDRDPGFWKRRATVTANVVTWIAVLRLKPKPTSIEGLLKVLAGKED